MSKNENKKPDYGTPLSGHRISASDFLKIVGEDAPVSEMIDLILSGNFSISPLDRDNSNHQLSLKGVGSLQASLDAVFCHIYRMKDLRESISPTGGSSDLAQITQKREASTYYTACELARVLGGWSQKYNPHQPKL